MTPTPRATAFLHAGITVADVDRSVAFYEQVLGLPVEARTVIESDSIRELVGESFTELTCVFLALPGGGSLELLQYGGVGITSGPTRPAQTATGHLCLRVEGLDEILRRARALGGTTISPEPVPSGRFPGARLVYLRDVDGYIVELLEAPAGPGDVDDGQ